MKPIVINWILFLVVVAYAVYLFATLVKTRIEYIKLGKEAEFIMETKERINAILTMVFGQKKLLKDKKSGIIHVMIFYGFLLVQFSTIDVIIKGLSIGNHLPLGPIYPYFTFFQEIVIVMIIIAVLWAFHRRYVEKLVRLKRGFKAGLVLIFIGGLMVWKMLAKGMEMIWLDMSTTWSQPIASGIASIFSGLSPTAAGVLFFVFWWLHLLFLLTFLVYIPQSKHAHLIAAPANVWLGPTHKVGQLESINFEDEEAEKFGKNQIEDFNQKQLLDLYACVECGRCTSVCPAAGTGKMLSPMDLIIKMRDHLTEKGAAVTSRKPWLPAFAFNNTRGNQLAAAAGAEVAATSEIYDVNLIGDVITEEELWACTTCRNCEDQCPVMNEHVDKIIDMRRYLVLTEGKMDVEAQRTIQNIEKQGNPWGISRKERENWREDREDIDVPTVKEMKKRSEEFEYLFFVGSMNSYDNRSKKIAQSFAKIMNEAGVKFAILGNKEKNSGDTPRRIGNEFLFQELAMANIKEFEKNNVKKIVTTDPHIYNTLKNEYPEFGLEAEVYHHTELIYQWIKEGRIQFTKEVNETIVFHDSCYLGRYNDIYDQPREILKAIPGVKLVEMERNRETAMCCGAGGGMMWMEEDTGTRINEARTEQALAVSPTVIGSACPYCLTMLSDGTKAKEVEDEVKTLDIAEIVERAM